MICKPRRCDSNRSPRELQLGRGHHHQQAETNDPPDNKHLPQTGRSRNPTHGRRKMEATTSAGSRCRGAGHRTSGGASEWRKREDPREQLRYGPTKTNVNRPKYQEQMRCKTLSYSYLLTNL